MSFSADTQYPPPGICYNNFMPLHEPYLALYTQARALLQPQYGRLSNMANLAALLYHTLPDINWAGFYLLEGSLLRLGPFQGKPACVEIPLGKGVCGTAAQQGRPLLVPDVHAFPGHIACDAASRSELVLPLLQGGQLWGVLDLDSPLPGRFQDQDLQGLQALVPLV